MHDESSLVILPGGLHAFVDSADPSVPDHLAAQALCGWALGEGFASARIACLIGFAEEKAAELGIFGDSLERELAGYGS